MLGNLPEHLLTPIISSIAIILGTVIGGVFSWIITKKSTDRSIAVQNKIVEDNRRYSERARMKRNYEYANIIRLDICTALFQCIRLLKGFEEKGDIDMYPIPMDSEYSSGIAYLKNEFDLKELSYIYQLYGIIEKLNRDTNNLNYYNNKDYNLIKIDCSMFLKKLYGDNFEKIIEVNIETISYKELYYNEIIKTGYWKVLKKLDEICSKE